MPGAGPIGTAGCPATSKEFHFFVPKCQSRKLLSVQYCLISLPPPSAAVRCARRFSSDPAHRVGPSQRGKKKKGNENLFGPGHAFFFFFLKLEIRRCPGDSTAPKFGPVTATPPAWGDAGGEGWRALFASQEKMIKRRARSAGQDLHG